MIKKSIAIILGLIFSLFVLEITIRASGYFFNKSRNQKEITKGNEFRILCIGNSHTVGSGVESSQAYPAVLQEKLQNFYRSDRIKVINGGQVGANSSMLLDQIPEQIKILKPNLVIVLTGEPNAWTWYGFSRFMSIKKNEIINFRTNSIFENPFVLFKHSHLFRFLEILIRKDNLVTEYSRYTELEKIMFWKSTMDGTLINVSERDLNELRINLEKYILKNDLKNTINGRDYYLVLAQLYRDQFHNWSRSIELMKQSILLKNEFDILVYKDINDILENKNLLVDVKTKAALIELVALAAKKYPGDNVYYKTIELFQYRNPNQLSLNELKKASQLIPGSSNIQKKLIEKILENKNINNFEKAKLYMDSIENVGPFSQANSFFIEKLNLLSYESKDLNLKKRILTYLENYKTKYPHAAESVGQLNKKILADWIAFDLDQMVKRLKEKNIPVLILNYHWLRGNYLEDTINSSLEDYSKEQAIPFSNVHQYFMNYVHQSKRIEADFFATRFGPRDNHPSVLGHQIIADKITEDIIKYNFINF